MKVEAKRLKKILSHHPAESTALIHLLQDIQAEWGYLPGEAISQAADHVGVPVSKAYSVATFYKAFSLMPRGKTTLRVCTGTACHIRGAAVLFGPALFAAAARSPRIVAAIRG